MKAFNTNKKKLKASLSLLLISLGLVAYQNCGENYKSNTFDQESQGVGVVDGEDQSSQVGSATVEPTPVNIDNESPANPIINPSLISTITQLFPENICFDPDGDGSGVVSGRAEACSGKPRLDIFVEQSLSNPVNASAQKSYAINENQCSRSLDSFSATRGCFEPTAVDSPAFRTYAQATGISRSGALAKFYPAGNTNEPLNKVLVIVSPFNPVGSATIDIELASILKVGASNNAKLSTLLSYLHVTGTSVLYISHGHLANTSLPLVDKARAVSTVLSMFNTLRVDKKNNAGYEKLNIIGLSLGGVVAKKALTLLEDIGLDHEVNLYMSMDSPHLGAHIPLGLQNLPGAISKVFEYAKDKTNLNGFFDKLIDDILDIDKITDTIALGANIFGQVADGSGTLLQTRFNNIHSNELLAYNILGTNLRTPEFIRMRQETSTLPRRTNKNIAIANGSISGVGLDTRNPFLQLRTSEKDKVTFSIFANPRGRQETNSYAWLRFPDRNTAFLGTRSYDYSYRSPVGQSEDGVPCATTTSVMQAVELGVNFAVNQNWPEKLTVYNYNTCFIPTASALASIDGNEFKNSSFTAASSAFDEIIGGSANTAHMFFSEEIVNQIIETVDKYREEK